METYKRRRGDRKDGRLLRDPVAEGESYESKH